MHSANAKTKPIASYFTKIPRSGHTSYEDENASSEIEVVEVVHTQDNPQLLFIRDGILLVVNDFGDDFRI